MTGYSKPALAEVLDRLTVQGGLSAARQALEIALHGALSPEHKPLHRSPQLERPGLVLRDANRSLGTGVDAGAAAVAEAVVDQARRAVRNLERARRAVREAEPASDAPPFTDLDDRSPHPGVHGGTLPSLEEIDVAPAPGGLLTKRGAVRSVKVFREPLP